MHLDPRSVRSDIRGWRTCLGQAALCQGSPSLPAHALDSAPSLGLPAQSRLSCLCCGTEVRFRPGQERVLARLLGAGSPARGRTGPSMPFGASICAPAGPPYPRTVMPPCDRKCFVQIATLPGRTAHGTPQSAAVTSWSRRGHMVCWTDDAASGQAASCPVSHVIMA